MTTAYDLEAGRHVPSNTGQVAAGTGSRGSLRILLLIDHLGSGGAQAILADIATLANRGRYRCLVGYYFGAPLYDDVLRSAGVELVHLGAGRGKLTAWAHALVPLRLIRLARRFRPHIIHVHTHTAPVMQAVILRSLLRAPRPRCVFTMHANLWQLGRGWRAYLRGWLSSFDRVVTEFDGAAEEVAFLGVPRARVTHIPFGARIRDVDGDAVMSARARCGVGPGDPLLVSVARLSPDRLLDRFIRALPDVVAEHPTVRLALVGDGTAEAGLRTLVRRLGLDAHVVFLGRSTDPMPWYHAADLYLTMSVTQTCDVGIAGWQAMLCGAPVLSIEPEPDRADGGPLPCAHLHRVSDVSILSRSISDLLAQPERRAQLAEAGRCFAMAHRSSASMTRDYLRLYEDLVPDASRHARGAGA